MNLRVRPAARFAGTFAVPGDKSISHRAALLGAVAEGPSDVTGFLESEDCLATIEAIRALGVEVTRKAPGHYHIAGVGLEGLQEPDRVIDCGNSGTTARLLPGILAGQPFWTVLTGDASLRRRPMGRVATPLREMGATVVGRAEGTKLPLAYRGTRPLAPLVFASPVASAQVKSAVLLAGLWARGPVVVIEPAPSRDHSERMLRQFGARVSVQGTRVALEPGSPLHGVHLHVPGDVSSAAFFLVAGAILPDAHVRITGVGVNPTRTGALDVLDAMGAPITREDVSADAEPSATLVARTAALHGTSVAGALIPRLIDEVPVLAVAAALANGRTEIRDAGELRVKESDRIAVLVEQLSRMGGRVEERPDGLVIEGPARLRGADVESHGDHRIAMALVVAGLAAATGETLVADTACIATSFPGFVDTVNALAGTDAVRVA